MYILAYCKVGFFLVKLQVLSPFVLLFILFLSFFCLCRWPFRVNTLMLYSASYDLARRKLGFLATGSLPQHGK